MEKQITTRDEAKALGLKRYFTGVRCKKGHVEERQTWDGRCTQCVEIWNALPANVERRKNYEKSPERKKYKIKRNKTPEGIVVKRKSHFKKTYNITIEERDSMLEAQDFQCAICSKVLTLDFKDGRKGNNTPKVDHNHETGKVRSILCNTCNVYLGYVDENPMMLRNVLHYIRRHNI